MSTSIVGEYKNGEIILSEKPLNILNSKVIITFLDNEFDVERFAIAKLSEQSFSEWNNEEDEVYDSL